jgi:ABC-type transport system involved in cytochrome bd biosynthesis fused ATPase/permease subunit
MKKFIYTLVLVFTLGISTSTVSAADTKKPKTELTAEQKVQFERLVNRVEEIRNMDKSNLSRTEKRALRKELKEMKEQARALNQGVYLSVGAIIIIILLLILIL